MTDYIIEGNINFNQELYKLLDEDSDIEDDDNLCKISGLPLTDKYVTLECNHRFNYEHLYKEIYKQKYIFKTYDRSQLSRAELKILVKSCSNFFIKCPYCRNLQFSVLPYYGDLLFKELYGINSLNMCKLNHISYNSNGEPSYYVNVEHTFELYNVIFKYGKCCTTNTMGEYCREIYVGTIPNTDLSYCRNHYQKYLALYKEHKHTQLIIAKESAKKQKEEIKMQRKKILEELNVERVTKGLPLLKRAPSIKQITPDANQDTDVCIAILKSGQNKGKQCCNKAKTNGLCKRHEIK